MYYAVPIDMEWITAADGSNNEVDIGE